MIYRYLIEYINRIVDTRDKKPKLYILLAQAVIILGIVSFLLYTDADRYAALSSGLIALLALLAIVQLVIAFFRQISYNPYSYNTIFYMGFALFFVTVMIMELFIMVDLIRFPSNNSFNKSLLMLLTSARNFVGISTPFVIVFALALCISNISLIKHEGKRLVNILGIILSFLMIAGEVLLFVIVPEVSNLLSAVYLYFECMLIGTIIADTVAARIEPRYDRDYLIILGCGIENDGTPTNLLRGRIEKALEFAEKQKEHTGREVTFITSGGQGQDEPIPESRAMRNYMISKGIPPERIIEENRSTSTFENMKFSKEIIDTLPPGGKIAFSTTNYHVFRGGLFARRVKMRAVGMSAKTKWYFWPNASVREFVGLLTEHKLKQAVIFGCLFLFYATLTILYRL